MQSGLASTPVSRSSMATAGHTLTLRLNPLRPPPPTSTRRRLNHRTFYFYTSHLFNFWLSHLPHPRSQQTLRQAFRLPLGRLSVTPPLDPGSTQLSPSSMGPEESTVGFVIVTDTGHYWRKGFFNSWFQGFRVFGQWWADHQAD